MRANGGRTPPFRGAKRLAARESYRSIAKTMGVHLATIARLRHHTEPTRRTHDRRGTRLGLVREAAECLAKQHQAAHAFATIGVG